MAITENTAEVTLGDGVVTIKRKGTSSLIVANILGKIVEDKTESIFLDRLVHDSHETELGSFAVSGAVSSILKKQLP